MEESLLHFQIKVGVVVWFSPPFYVQLHSIDLCHCFSMYMYLQFQYCASYSLNINFQSVHVSDTVNHNLCIYSSENEEKIDLTLYCTCILKCKRMLTLLVMVSYTVI